MANDNSDSQATLKEIQRLFEGKGYDSLVGRWASFERTGEIVLIKGVNLSQGNGAGHKVELSLMSPNEVIGVVNLKDADAQQDAFFESSYTLDIDHVDDLGIKTREDDMGSEALLFCDAPTGLGNIRLSDDLQAFLGQGILGAIRTPDMALTGFRSRTPGPITGIHLANFDGERFSLQLTCAFSYAHSPDVYDVTTGDILIKRDPGAPERAPGRVLPLRRPSKDI